MSVFLGALVGALALVGAALGATPVGSQFQVNSYTSGNQTPGFGQLAVAIDADGDFVVVWQSFGSAGSDTSGSSVHGQRYDARGNAVGSEFQVNTYTTDYQGAASVAVGADGDFVVVWNSEGSAGSDSWGDSIQGQRYDASGSAVGAQFQVNTHTPGYQIWPVVAIDADGDFVVVWVGDPTTPSARSSIQGQRFDANGNRVGGEFQVNTYTTGWQLFNSLAMDADGNFVVVWQSDGSTGTDTDSQSIQGQRYAANGSKIGGQFQVNTYTTTWQGFPSVALDADGDFVVTWNSYRGAGTDSRGYSIQGQRYDASGSAVGAQFQVNTYTTAAQWESSVAMDEDGDFVVVWTSGYLGALSIEGQDFDTSGNKVGSEFQVNTYTTSDQRLASVAINANGDFVVVWQSDGSAASDSSERSVQGQRYACEASTPLPLASRCFVVAVAERDLGATVAGERHRAARDPKTLRWAWEMPCLRWTPDLPFDPDDPPHGIPERCLPDEWCPACSLSASWKPSAAPDLGPRIYETWLRAAETLRGPERLRKALESVARLFEAAPAGGIYTEEMKRSVAGALREAPLEDGPGPAISSRLSWQVREGLNAIELERRVPDLRSRNVPVGKRAPVDLGGVARIDFHDVVEAGSVSLGIHHRWPALPEGFAPLWPEAAYRLAFTGELAPSGLVEIELYVDGLSARPDRSELRLLEWDGERYRNITTRLPGKSEFIGGTTRRLATYVVAQPLRARSQRPAPRTFWERLRARLPH